MDNVLSTREGADILRNGLYGPPISMWRHVFGGEAVHVWNREEYDAAPAGVMEDVFAFLDVPRFEEVGQLHAFEGHHDSHPISEMSSASREALGAYYESGGAAVSSGDSGG